MRLGNGVVFGWIVLCTGAVFGVNACGTAAGDPRGSAGRGTSGGASGHAGSTTQGRDENAGTSTSSGGTDTSPSGGAGTSSSAGAGNAPSTSGGRAGHGGGATNGGASSAGGPNAGGNASGAGGTAPDVDNCGPAPVEGWVLEGSLAISSAADLAAAQRYSKITGDLLLPTGMLEVSLPNLVEIGGEVRADSLALQSLLLPNLRSIGGTLWLYLNMSLLDVDFRRLHHVGGEVYIHRNRYVRSLQLFSLESVNGKPIAEAHVTVTAQLDLPACFDELLKARYPLLQITSTGGPVCACTLRCELALDADC